jgi:NADH-quinone oxidoreductase subunit E
MSLAKKYPKEVRQILSKYPPEYKRSAVMPLLHLAQSESGYVTQAAMEDIAGILEISVTDVGAIVGFYSLYHDKKEGRYRLQVCTDLPCALRGADQFMESLCGRLGLQPGETTPDGNITLESVTCLAACDRAPMFQVQSPDGLQYYEDITLDKTMDLIATLSRKSRESA